MTTLYCIDLGKPFKGTVDFTATKETGLVHYSGALYNNKGPDFTISEYIKFQGIANYEALEWDVFYDKYIKKHLQAMQKDFTEISKEQYWEMLECLPPMKWHDLNNRFNVFFCMEARTAHIHSCYIKDKTNDKYYHALRSKFASDEELLLDIKKVATVKNYCVGSSVIWKGKKCIVTNACIAGGKYIQISPVGNGNSPAKYYQIEPDQVKPE